MPALESDPVIWEMEPRCVDLCLWGATRAQAARRSARSVGKALADTCFEVVSLSREGHNQPHTLKDTRPVPQVWGTPLFLEKPAHETGLMSGSDSVFIKNQSDPGIRPVVFSFQVKHQTNSGRPETGLMHSWPCSEIMKSCCGVGLEHPPHGQVNGQALQLHTFPRNWSTWITLSAFFFSVDPSRHD